MIGRTLDHYRIESKLGQGGMGVVYRALDLHLNRVVAIKVLPADAMGDRDRKERFVREARAASALNHPNIVTIHDVRSDDGVDFIVMEHVEGRTLAELIPAAGMRPELVLQHAVQIANGLARAHDAGIVHRDVKPSNLMVSEDGRVRILDFGLAKLSTPRVVAPDADTIAKSLTEEGMLIGTTSYMSPEQAEGRRVDARTDIFSFGAVLYEMVTGRRPFRADSQLGILAKILHDDPVAPSEIAPSIPAELERIILRCLRKDLDRRYQTMKDLEIALADLHAELRSGTANVRPGAKRARSRWLWLAVLPLLVIAAWFVWRRIERRADSEPLDAIALTTFSGAESHPSLSPDGNYVTFMWDGPARDNTDVYVQLIGSGAPLRLTTDPRSDTNPVWSPDGRLIAFLSNSGGNPLMAPVTRELRLIPPTGGPERKLADVSSSALSPHPAFLTWCPDSTCLVVTDSTGAGKPEALFVVSVESGEKRQLTTPRAPALADTSPAISPDGRWLVFLRSASWDKGELHLMALGENVTARGEPKRVTEATLRADYPVWLPDSEEVLFSARNALWKVAIDGDLEPRRVPFIGQDAFMATVSRPQPGKPSRLVYARIFQDTNIWRVDTPSAGAPATSLPSIAVSSTRDDTHPRFSPDGRRVAFTSTRSGDWEIWLADPDGGNAVQLTSMRGPGGTGAPHWSPDGRTIVFASDREGDFNLYAVPASGGKPRRLTANRDFDHCPAFSHDGKALYFCSKHTGTGYELWKMPPTGGSPIQVTHGGGWYGEESSDGASFFFKRVDPADTTLWRQPVSGGTPVRFLEDILGFAFDVTTRGIYYADRPASDVRLRFYDFASRKSTTIASTLGNVGLSECCPTVSPDGRTILYPRVDSSVFDLMLVESFR